MTGYKEAGSGSDAQTEVQKRIQGLRAFPVHRLEEGTCGVLLFGIDPRFSRVLREAFKGRSVRKTYLAIIGGEVAPGGKISTPLDRKDGPPEPALTHYARIKKLTIG